MSRQLSSKNAQCSACSLHRLRLQRAIRSNERRLRSGRPVDLTEIDTAKEDMRACAERGHHNPTAGPDARWHSTA